MGVAITTTCPYCGTTHDYGTGIGVAPNYRPKVGDVTMCIECGEFSEVAPNGTLVIPTQAKLDQVYGNPDAKEALYIRYRFQNRRLRGESTDEFLARQLESHGMPELAKRALTGEFNDFTSSRDFPRIEFLQELVRVGTNQARELIKRNMEGEFDILDEEAIAWSKSEDAKAVLAGDPSLRADVRRRKWGQYSCTCGLRAFDLLRDLKV